MVCSHISRRSFIRSCAATAALGPATAVLAWGAEGKPLDGRSGPARRVISLNDHWLFGGKNTDAPLAFNREFDDRTWKQITLPHCVTDLSWQNWDPAAWEDVWIYRKHFSIPPEWRGLRYFLHFDRILAGAEIAVNSSPAWSPPVGGFLPVDYEITGFARTDENVLAVLVDSRWLNAPPSGSPRGPSSIDYLLPGGIAGSVELRAVPHVFLRELFARPVDVLGPNRRVEIECLVDARDPPPADIRIEAELSKDGRVLSNGSLLARLDPDLGDQRFNLTLHKLHDVLLWEVDHPHLYDLDVTLFLDGQPVHRYATRIGLREARFEIDGFYLNGRRLQLFGLNRHELYPYVGFAVPERLLRRDAEILRRKFNCNAVRCSHYPQSEAFLDACDELGLLVWEELPGWQYIGDNAWQDLAVRDVEAMIRRDRNHPSIVIWGVRINESANDSELYGRTWALAKSLDASRPASGTMTPSSRKDWQTEWSEDVFAYDDYHSAPDGSVGILDPVEGFPYMIAETVGQFNYRAGKGFAVRYRRAGDRTQQTDQALFHAQAHNRAADHPRIAGAIAWCAFDYGSLMNAYNAVKCPGIADVFRIPKLGASFYVAQVDPSVRPVIEPNFYWDFGPQTPSGPGEHAAIFSNCERLELSIDGQPHATLHPERSSFPHLKYPPFIAHLMLEGSQHPELHIDGYVKNARVLSRSFSSDRSADRLWLHAEDTELVGDGSDATRVAFARVDKYGAQRPFAIGEVSLAIDGPGEIVGDNPFLLDDNGGAGAVYVRTLWHRAGRIRVEARHAVLGSASVELQVRT
ncbi:MAG: glycoside hydrolase family 2 TIM barrel-domain containing protein [Terracidiphilus sp.]